MTHLVVTLPIRLESVANLRECWRKRASRAKTHRLQAWAELRALKPSGVILGPVTVKLTRIAPRQLDDDNLRSAFKACRDGVADWLQVDDGDSRIQWVYGQEKGPPKTYSARIEVQA
jgi:hypothetical protein